MAGEAIRVASGKHTRRMELEAVRQVCLAALVMLVVQYGLGMILNLYIAVPISDAHAGITQEIANGPVMLTLHALLGLGLIGAALVALVRAIRLDDRTVAVLAAAGLTAIGAAFASGEIFVRNGQSGASLAMGLLTGIALLCYIGALTRVSSALRRRGPG